VMRWTRARIEPGTADEAVGRATKTATGPA